MHFSCAPVRAFRARPIGHLDFETILRASGSIWRDPTIFFARTFWTLLPVMRAAARSWCNTYRGTESVGGGQSM